MIRRFEGLRLRPYLCSAGVATIGYGSTFYEDGARVTLRDPEITAERAEQLLQHMIRIEFMPKTVSLCPGADTPPRIAALCDFAFNLGTGNLRSSTLRKRVNTGDWEDAVTQILKWDKAGGKRLRGLTRRRQAEAELLP
jgi:lysozyme